MSSKDDRFSVYLFTMVFASVLLVSVTMSTNEAFAMGQAPSTCTNRYDGSIISAKIMADGITYDPMAEPGLTFELSNNMSYDVTFTIRTPTQSSQGNSEPGTVWYRSTALGYGNGVCVDGIGPNQDVTITSRFSHPSNMAPESTQGVEFGTLVSSGFYYNIMWVNPDNPTPPQSTTSVLNVLSADMSGNSFDGMWVELWQNGQIIQEGPTPFSVEVQSGSDYEVFMGNWENLIFDHWEDRSIDARRSINISEDTALTAFFNTNNLPEAGNDSAETTINQPVTIDVLANDSDPDGDSLIVDSITTGPEHGSVTINEDNTITYRPNLAFIGTDSFGYQISDGNGGTDTAVVSITVDAIAIPPLPILP